MNTALVIAQMLVGTAMLFNTYRLLHGPRAQDRVLALDTLYVNGLLTLKTFYERVHPPTMGTTLGTGLVLIGSMVFFTVQEGRPVLHELLIGAFMTLTTPVTYLLLVRAALYRDRAEGRDPLAPKDGD